MTDEEDISEVADDVNDMAENLSDPVGPGMARRYVVSPVQAIVTALPLLLSIAVVGLTHFDIYDVPMLQAKPLAYAGTVLAGAGLSYLLYRTIYAEEDDGYTPGPGERLEV
jgi:hypothetical protein